MSSWHSYPSIFNLGHKAVAELLNGPVLVEEKVDGSQFSFGKFTFCPSEPDHCAGCEDELKFRSKSVVMESGAPEGMFKLALESVRARAHLLHPGWTYRCEYLMKPKHNALVYDRVPRGNLIVFDVNTDEEAYLSYVDKAAEAARIGLECVPLIHEGIVDDLQMFKSFLNTQSVLGGQLVEGVVVKPVAYDQFGVDHKCLMGKYVSEAYKEVHSASWKLANPKSADILIQLEEAYRTPARWMKAVQHLRDAGILEDSPRDIGPLLKELDADLTKEETDEIRDRLFTWAMPHLKRGLRRGFPEWYKSSLLDKQFEVQS